MAEWILRGGISTEYSQQFNVNPLVGKILASRMSLEEAKEYLNPFSEPADPFLLPDMNKAVSVLKDAVSFHKKVRIVGDYDVDGISSAAVFYTALKHYDVDVDVYLPERIEEGYGFNDKIVSQIISDQIELVISCDNGIRESARVQAIKDAGISFLLTDHHQPDVDHNNLQILPNADAVVNPSRKDSRYPQSEICGAFVAYLTILALSKDAEFSSLTKILPQLIGFAAFGTVCDVMPLVRENRKCVAQGLKELSECPFVGLRALCDCLHFETNSPLSAFDIAFRLGPCLNAGGRLENQNKFFSFWYETDYAKAYEIASALCSLNNERSELTQEGIAAAFVQEAQYDPEEKVKVYYLPHLHESVAGLVAGKLKEKLHRPVLVFTDSQEGFKGSGRSVSVYNLIEHLNRVSDIFSKYGGHASAAGFSIAGEDKSLIDELRSRLNSDCEFSLEDMQEPVYLDAAANMEGISMELIRSLNILEPFGNGNPKPLFGQKNLQMIKAKFMGSSHKAVRYTFKSELKTFEAVSFKTENLSEIFSEEELDLMEQGFSFRQPIYVDVCYNAELNEYNGVISPQFVVNFIRRKEA